MTKEIADKRDAAPNSEHAENETEKSDESLFGRVMDERLLPPLKLSNESDSTSDSTKLKSGQADASALPAGTDSNASIEAKISKVFSELPKSNIFVSASGAAMAIANALANNPRMLDALKDIKPVITPTVVDQMRSVVEGLEQRLNEAAPYELPPKFFEQKDVKTLDTVRKHMETLSNAGVIGADVGLKVSEMPEFSNEKIAARLAARQHDLIDIAKIEQVMQNSDHNDGIMNRLLSPVDADLEKRQAAQKLNEKENVRGRENEPQLVSPEKPESKPADKASQKDYREEPKSLKDEASKDAKPEGGKAGKEEASKDAKPEVLLLNQKDFAEVAKRVFDKIDKDGSGKITRDEIYKAIEDPTITGQDAQALTAMYTNFRSLANLAGKQGIFEWSGITKADLDKVSEVASRQQTRVDDAYRMEAWAKSNMHLFDRSGNGKLNFREIDAALRDPKISDYDKQNLQLVRDNYQKIGPDGQAGVSLKAIEEYTSKVYQTNEGKLIAVLSASAWQTARSQRPEISRDLYGDSKDPLNSIVPDAIKQGTIGNCYFHASLAAVAKSNPQLIKDMIKDNGDGTYTVTFPGAKDEPITVKAPTEAEQGLYNRGSEHGTWANVLEKAYGQYSQTFYRRGLFNPTGGNTPAEGGDGGGRPEGVMKLLTGSSTDTDMLLINSQSSIARKLEDAFSSVPPKAVAAGINNLFFWNTTSDGFYAAHAYSVTGFKPDGKGGGMVTIRNPWAGEDGTTQGTISIPLEKFIKNFSQIIFEYR
ncbi:MAG: hypothetical protein K2X77_12700 [Candidatus Obscuribacterales bacterium]|nr:hypothetical protein [Candidatus Obscuribacterales bacterium]